MKKRSLAFIYSSVFFSFFFKVEKIFSAIKTYSSSSFLLLLKYEKQKQRKNCANFIVILFYPQKEKEPISRFCFFFLLNSHFTQMPKLHCFVFFCYNLTAKKSSFQVLEQEYVRLISFQLKSQKAINQYFIATVFRVILFFCFLFYFLLLKFKLFELAQLFYLLASASKLII